MSFLDPERVRPMNGWVLVKLDPNTKRTSSGLYKPDKAYEHIFRTGTVLKVGSGPWGKKEGTTERTTVRRPMDVKEGEKVLFIRFVANTHTGEQLRQQYLGDKHVLLQEEDFLLVGPPEEFERLGIR